MQIDRYEKMEEGMMAAVKRSCEATCVMLVAFVCVSSTWNLIRGRRKRTRLVSGCWKVQYYMGVLWWKIINTPDLFSLCKNLDCARCLLGGVVLRDDENINF